MSNWQLIQTGKSVKQFNSLESKYKKTALTMLEELENDPKKGSVVLVSTKKSFRKKQGRVRIKFYIEEEVIVVYYIGLRAEKTYK